MSASVCSPSEGNRPAGCGASVSIRCTLEPPLFFLVHVLLYVCQYWRGTIIVFALANTNDKTFLRRTPVERLKRNNIANI